MKKHRVKVIEEANEISWSATYQGIIEVDGTRVEYRYFESDKSSEFYVWNIETGSWDEYYGDEEDPESPEAVALNLCTMNSPIDMGVVGEEYDYEMDDEWL